jgi:phosphatidylserine/phosphatidylglycerophosphate/cardiolipin synthase-like enzyme/uncharacterized membrane protein YdjX (TVP38/TMEM64 family)
MLEQGRNCWQKAQADRVALLIDGDAYFEAFRAAVRKARQSILIIGWDIDSRIPLGTDDPADGWPLHLGDFLNAVVAHHPHLQANILIWDFAMIYALEREPLPLFRLQWSTHHRLHFSMDDRHPLGGSHHQKIVVIDDALAFVGGIDLTKCRWDTTAHQAHDPRRVNVNGEPYAPFHDVQMMVDGGSARVLGELARTRWNQATGERLQPPLPREDEIWPEGFQPDLEHVEVDIARTEPAHEDTPEIREVERLYLDAIEAARHSIYIENQYFSCAAIGKALADRLSEPEGPDIVIVLPRNTAGWLEQTTMDVLRARLLRKLRAADLHDRLRLYYPDGPGLDERCSLIVHAKVLVVDDQLLRVGSSNLSNRSMGLDTECDLAIEAGNRADLTRAIGDFRNRLLGEHLGTSPDTVSEAIVRQGSLIAAIDSLRTNERTLRDLDGRVPDELDALVPEAALIDPEKPLELDLWVDKILPSKEQTRERERKFGPWLKVLALLGGVLALAAIWRWSPLSEWLNVDYLVGWANDLRDSPLGPVVVLGGFAIGSLVAFPITVLIVATLLVFEPALGFVYALTGTLAGAALTYGAGYWLGRNTIRRMAGSRLNRLSRRLSERGVITIATVRLVPVAPFTVINLVAGASHIRFRDYLLGTLLGMGPGLVGLTVFADSLYRVLRNPDPAALGWVAVVVIVIGATGFGLRRWLQRRGGTSAPAAGTED